MSNQLNEKIVISVGAYFPPFCKNFSWLSKTNFLLIFGILRNLIQTSIPNLFVENFFDLQSPQWIVLGLEADLGSSQCMYYKIDAIFSYLLWSKYTIEDPGGRLYYELMN